MAKIETLDLAVIGAGFAGLAAASTNLAIHPSSSTLVLDSSPTIGGVWASHRLYPGLKTNNLLGTYEYSDFPMSTETYGVNPGEFIPGEVVHQYLNDYARSKVGLERLRLGTKVISAEHREEGGWVLTVKQNGDGEKEEKLIAKKLVFATGFTSEAYLPKFAGIENFGVPLFHSKDFLQNKDTLETTGRAVVFGGTKSAWDAVYAYASRGVEVDWVIRESGHGPTWMAPPYVTPLKRWLEKLVHTRFLTWFSPCIWGAADGYTSIRSFFHGTGVGRVIVDTFWSILGNDVITLNKYDAHPETAKLKPWSNPFFVASGLSILNYPTDIFDFVRDGKVKVHIADIVSLGAKSVSLSDGTKISDVGALVAATGWKHSPPLKILPENLDLSIPHKPTSSEPKNLIKKADEEILNQFPRLKDQPAQNKNFKPLVQTEGISDPKDEAEDSLTPYRLYRFIIPPSLVAYRDTAFAGALMSITTAIIAQTQALWISAYFDNALPSLPGSVTEDDITYETILHSRFGKWRYPAGYGERFPDFVFDALSYVDLLIGEVGVKAHRKGSALAEVFSAYGPEDYKGLVGEYLEVQKAKEARGNEEL